ncbi:MAG: hypothetical protein PHR87_03895 [Sulfurospirillaceae bacterium]|nr:hypothetical protein [Sulfurospirillaceae bacterium]
MRLLLINNNPAVSRLLKLSVEKAGHEMDEFEEYGLVPLKSYDVIMVDNELYDENEVIALKEQTHCDYCIYVCQRGAIKPDSINVTLEKPFLPTDFLAMLEKVKNVLESQREHTAPSISLDDIEKDEFDEVNTFDIDSIDELDNQTDDMLDDEDKEEEENFMPDISDDNDEMSLPTFDLETKEEDLDLSFVSKDTVDEDLELDDKQSNEVLEEDMAESATSVLDKDDINEVKQLLDDDESTSEESSQFEDVSSDTLDDEEDFEFDEIKETLPLSFDDEESSSVELENESIDDDKMLLESEDYGSFEKNILDDVEEDDLSFKEEQDEPLSIPTLETLDEDEPLSLEDDEESSVALENDDDIDMQEDIIEDFEEEMKEEDISPKDEIVPNVAVKTEVSDDVSSLDELNENLIKKAFGEDVDEEDTLDHQEDALQEIEVIRGEIENSISKSISGFAQSDILREALRGMKINISITFDDKN